MADIVTNKVKISIVAGKALVFSLDDVKRLRNLGVGGVLSGTLPSAPQQNIFLGLPLQLMVEEVVWLVTNNHAFLVPDDKFIKDIFDNLSETDVATIQRTRADDFQTQKQLKIKQLNEKVQSSNKTNRNYSIPDDLTITQSLMVTIPNTPNELPGFDLFQDIYQKNEILQSQLLKTLKYNPLNYLLFSYLKSKGYFLAPGLRFGGKFIGYPGDPLRYHAHLIVNTFKSDQDIGLMNIVNGGRLATGVKKVWLVGSELESSTDDNDEVNDDNENEEENVVCFSIEWAGFG